MKLKFSRINFGHPVAVDEELAKQPMHTVQSLKGGFIVNKRLDLFYNMHVLTVLSSHSVVDLVGLPVSQGIAQGKARVITSLADATQIEAR